MIPIKPDKRSIVETAFIGCFSKGKKFVSQTLNRVSRILNRVNYLLIKYFSSLKFIVFMRFKFFFAL